MSSFSTHVLDTALGAPAAGIPVTLATGANVICSGTTDADGRYRDPLNLAVGDYQLTFLVAEYFGGTRRESFYSEIVIRFRVAAAGEHYHVPLLLSPFGYSTYRGS